MRNELLKSKFLYKGTTLCIKYMPMVLAAMQITMTLFNYFGIAAISLSFIGGTSLLFLGLLFLLSYLFQYCSLYRFPLLYNLTMGFLVTLRTYGCIAIELLAFYQLLMIVTGIFILIFIYLIYKYRNHSKLGGIKQFCDKYLDCKF